MSQNIVVVGASGYTGAEALRILARHPDLYGDMASLVIVVPGSF